MIQPPTMYLLLIAHTLIPVQQLSRRSLASLVTRMFGTISLISLFTTAAHYRQERGRESKREREREREIERERERERERGGGGGGEMRITMMTNSTVHTRLRDNYVT